MKIRLKIEPKLIFLKNMRIKIINFLKEKAQISLFWNIGTEMMDFK